MSYKRVALQLICLTVAFIVMAPCALGSDERRARQDRAQIMFENWGGEILQLPSGRQVLIHEQWVGTDEDLAQLHAAGDFYKIFLRSERVTDRSLATLAGLQGVEEFYISECRLSEDGVAWLRGFPNLKKINLSKVHVSDRACAALGQLPSLETLSVREGQHITAHGLQSLLACTNLKEMTVVGLQPEALATFCRESSLRNKSVTNLRLSVDMIDAESIRKLQQLLPNLCTLHLGWSKLDDTALAELRTAAPKIDIRHSPEEKVPVQPHWCGWGQLENPE